MEQVGELKLAHDSQFITVTFEKKQNDVIQLAIHYWSWANSISNA